MAGRLQAEDSVRKRDPCGPQSGQDRRAEALENPGDDGCRAGFPNQARRGKTVLSGDRQREADHHRMQVQVRVPIPVGRRKAQSDEALELPVDFLAQRSPQPGKKRVLQTRSCG